MDAFEAIAKRHCYRGQFSDELVKREDLTKIVQAGLDAPSGCNRQTTTFVIVDDPKLVGEIAKMHPANKGMFTAKAFVACIINRVHKPVYEGTMSFEVEDCSTAVENMLLAITALGYAGGWIDGWLRVGEHNEIIGNMLGLPHDKILRVILPIGIPAEEIKPPMKMPFDDRAWFNRYKL